jgi:hypothetical protein
LACLDGISWMPVSSISGARYWYGIRVKTYAACLKGDNHMIFLLFLGFYGFI